MKDLIKNTPLTEGCEEKTREVSQYAMQGKQMIFYFLGT